LKLWRIKAFLHLMVLMKRLCALLRKKSKKFRI
jgi:hypothetical protein